MLLDPAHEDYDAFMPAELTKSRANRAFAVLNAITNVMLSTPVTKAVLGGVPVVRRYQRLYRDLFGQEMSDWPTELASALIERHTSLDWLAVGLREARKLDDLYAEVRNAGPMPDIPVVILCSMSTDGFQQAVSGGQTEEQFKEETAAKLRLYTDITAGLAIAEVRPVDSGHVTLPSAALRPSWPRSPPGLGGAGLEAVADAGLGLSQRDFAWPQPYYRRPFGDGCQRLRAGWCLSAAVP